MDKTMNNKHYFIVNKYNHYFIVQDLININELKDCKLFDTKQDLYNFISKVYGVPFDDISCSHFLINNGILWDDMCNHTPIKQSTESFISGFEL